MPYVKEVKGLRMDGSMDLSASDDPTGQIFCQIYLT